MNAPAIARKRDMPTAEDGAAFVEEVRRDFFIKKGKLHWRKRDVSRFDAKFPERAAAIWNSRFGNKPAGKRDKRMGKDGALFVRLGTRSWPVEKLVRALETGVAPFETAVDGIASSDDLFIGEGPLGLALAGAMAASGLGPGALTVLSHKYDPFRFDTPERHRDAAWFTELFERLVGPDEIVHIRGLHYRLVSEGGAIKPDGTPYRNTDGDYTFLGDAAKRARWLGYVPFERIVDHRNDAPTEYRAARSVTPTPAASVSAILFSGGWESVSFISAEAPLVTLGLGEEASLSRFACQPYPRPVGPRRRAAVLLRVLRREKLAQGGAAADRSAVWGEPIPVFGRDQRHAGLPHGARCGRRRPPAGGVHVQRLRPGRTSNADQHRP